MAKNGFSFVSYLKGITGKIYTTAEKRAMRGAMEWHAGVMEILSGTRSGRIYKVPGTNRSYQASAPGEPPAVATGRLRASYQFRTVKNKRKVEADVGSPLDYALYLEHGTKRMAPRPHVLPAYYNREKQIKAHLRRRWF